MLPTSSGSLAHEPTHRAAGGHPIAIAPAEGRGSGAFAAAPIPAGSFLEQYVGERVDDAELVRRYGPDFFATGASEHGGCGGGAARPLGEYVFSLGGGWNLDAQDPSQSNWTRFINHSAVAPNVRACVRRDADVLFVLLHRDGVGADDDDGDDDDTAAWRDLEVDGARVELWTTRAVCAGDELLLNYGPEFAAWIARRAAAQQDARRDRAGTTGGDVPDLDVADAGLF